jgi:hypothetical protein
LPIEQQHDPTGSDGNRYAFVEEHHPLARAEAIRALAAHKALIECASSARDLLPCADSAFISMV